MATGKKKTGRAEKNAREVWGGIATAMEQVAESVSDGGHGKVVVTIFYRNGGVREVRVNKQVDGEG